MKRCALVCLLLFACTKETPIAEPQRPAERPVASAAPAASIAPKPLPETPKEPEKITCFTAMPEQSCSIGCDSEEGNCARDCAFKCDACTKKDCAEKEGAALAACEAKCISTKDRCASGDCAKRRKVCEKADADEVKKHYGCKKKDIGAACDELFDCLQDEKCKAKNTCKTVCEQKTGCDAYFQGIVGWNGCVPFHDHDGGAP